MLGFLSPAAATDSQPYPEFTAVYDARINGFLVAEARFSLHKLDSGDYLYQKKLSIRWCRLVVRQESFNRLQSLAIRQQLDTGSGISEQQ